VRLSVLLVGGDVDGDVRVAVGGGGLLGRRGVELEPGGRGALRQAVHVLSLSVRCESLMWAGSSTRPGRGKNSEELEMLTGVAAYGLCAGCFQWRWAPIF